MLSLTTVVTTFICDLPAALFSTIKTSYLNTYLIRFTITTVSHKIVNSVKNRTFACNFIVEVENFSLLQE